ncbi:hypothetical protein L211DRAFT_84066 [Terfezia boudieri ATCC MYA-4762]|uniref:Uncharacterized protein n=1 Tax=Terfezia boudieri ATCC MYA-4762 TaxID=1051890 RepID=A0A3N4LRE6_9PEZI|nr:hypothetical protein L211DRAFT_84066 [Terfezia boudieri ATCC MYA-4762]
MHPQWDVHCTFQSISGHISSNILTTMSSKIGSGRSSSSASAFLALCLVCILPGTDLTVCLSAHLYDLHPMSIRPVHVPRRVKPHGSCTERDPRLCGTYLSLCYQVLRNNAPPRCRTMQTETGKM